MLRLSTLTSLILLSACAGAGEDRRQNTSKLIAQHDELRAELSEDLQANRLDEARAKAETLVELDRRIIEAARRERPDDADFLNARRYGLAYALQWLAEQYQGREEFPRAIRLREEMVPLLADVFGDEHFQVADARRALHDTRLFAGLTDGQRRELAKAEMLQQAGAEHSQTRDYPQAVKAFEEAVAIQARVLGRKHKSTRHSMWQLGLVYWRGLDDRAKGEPLVTESVESCRAVLGESNPETAICLGELGQLYHERRDYEMAEPLMLKSLEINSRVLGRAEATAISYHHLGLLYVSMGDFVRAEPMYGRGLEIYAEVLGEEHPNTTMMLDDLAGLYNQLGDYAQAAEHYQRRLQAFRKISAGADLDIAASLQDLGTVYMRKGDYAAAEPMYRESLEIYEKLFTDNNTSIAAARNSLGVLYALMGDYARAEPIYQQSLEIAREKFGEDHEDTASYLNNLGGLHNKTGDYAKAERLYRQALEIHSKTLGDDDPRTATDCMNLGVLYRDMGEFTEAERLLKRGYESRRKVLGENHPDTATSLHYLGTLYVRMGDYAKAEPLFRRGLKIRADTLGDNHPYTARELSHAGALALIQNRRDQAKELLRKSLTIQRHVLEATAAVQAERQQFLMNQNVRHVLDNWISAVRDANCYGDVLRWKGAIFVRQADLRAVRKQPSLKKLVGQLRSVSSRLAKLALDTPKAEHRKTHQRQVAELAQQQEDLERELTRESIVYRQAKELSELTPDHLRQVLPEKTALIDLLEYKRLVPPAGDQQKHRHERQVVAFIVRPDQPVKRVDLGSAEVIAGLVDRWHVEARDNPASPQAEPAVELRRRLWNPLEEQLEGIETVLISPDGSLGKLPFGALPGSKPRTFLLEDRPLAVIPVPQTLVALLKPVEDGEGESADSELSMLVLGGINYDADVTPKTTRRGRPAARRAGEGMTFRPLGATRGEAMFIEQTVRDYLDREELPGRLRRLDSHLATEEAVRKLAPGTRYLHFATHGFFAPEQLVSALDSQGDRGMGAIDQERFPGYHPGLLSGLALAGANKPRPNGEDGVLTALEVAEMDLSSVRLAVLSACETGLGRVAGGEGLLGLQRSFQMAGARSVVTSLWKVDDTATRSLMERFYTNYWTRTEDGGFRGMLESLREAQLWMLREEGRKRGFSLREEKDAPSKTRLVPPNFWAAFVLSGDWR